MLGKEVPLTVMRAWGFSMGSLVRALGVGLDWNLGIRISKLAQEKIYINPEKL